MRSDRGWRSIKPNTFAGILYRSSSMRRRVPRRGRFFVQSSVLRFPLTTSRQRGNNSSSASRNFRAQRVQSSLVAFPLSLNRGSKNLSPGGNAARGEEGRRERFRHRQYLVSFVRGKFSRRLLPSSLQNITPATLDTLHVAGRYLREERGGEMLIQWQNR